MTMRFVAVAVIALLLAVQVVRVAGVRALAESRPADAARLWAEHPLVGLSVGLTAIATATRERRPVAPDSIRRIYSASAKAPLLPEPFLTRGVEAQVAGNAKVAEQAFVQAKWRDGRSIAARYFLADHYFRAGDGRRGLAEIPGLARLVPNGAERLAPYVASYAHDRSNWPALRALFKSEPLVEERALSFLAADAANADTVVALSYPPRRSPTTPWLPSFLATLVKAGEYDKARRIWAIWSKVDLDPGMLVYDPDFRRPEAPAPFNWTLASSTLGLAERQRRGGLHAIYYGQMDGALASQLLLLPPGRYRFSAVGSAGENAGDMLRWAVTCEKGARPLGSASLSSALGRSWTFDVPADCPAQRLELLGSSSDLPQQADVTIHSVSLVRSGGNG